MSPQERMAMARAAREAKRAARIDSVPSKSIKMANFACSRHVPASFKGLFERLGNSKALRIKAKCIECSNFQKSEVRHCQVYTCPLWPVRPYRSETVNQSDT